MAEPPDIPEPTREDLFRLADADERQLLELGGGLPANVNRPLWATLRRRWYEGHRAALAKASAESDTTATKETVSEPEKEAGTRVIGQQAAPTEQEQRDAKLLAFMDEQVRAAYDAADFERKEIIWEANKRAFEEAEIRKEQTRLREQERMGKILDTLQRIKEDPAKAHLLPSANADLHEWYEEISKPTDRPDFGNPPDVHSQQKAPTAPPNLFAIMDETTLHVSKDIADEMQKVNDRAILDQYQSYEAEKADRQKPDRDQEIGLPLADGAIPPDADSGFSGTFRDVKQSEMDVPKPDQWLPVTPDLARWKEQQRKTEELKKQTLGDALEPMQDKATIKTQKTVGVKTVESTDPADLARSPTMVRFFSDVERFREHFAWIGNWPVVSVIATGAWGGGVAAMQMNQLIIAIGFFVFASFLLTVKAIASEKDRERTYIIATLAVLFLIVNIAWAIYSHMHFSK